MKITITSISCKRVSLEEKMAIGSIGTGNTFTMAKLNTGRDTLQFAFSCTGGRHRSVCFAERAERLAGVDGVEIEVTHAAKPYWKKVCSNETDCVNQRGEMK